MSQVLARVSDTGLMVGIVSGCGIKAKLVTKISGAVGRGIGMGDSSTPTSGSALLELAVKGRADIGGGDSGEVGRLTEDAFFFLQERDVAFGSVTGWDESSECSEFLPPSAEPLLSRLGWLNFLNKWERGMCAILKDPAQNPC